MPDRHLGEPIPKGYVNKTGVHLAELPAEGPERTAALLARLESLKADVAMLVDSARLLRGGIGRTVQRHPMSASLLASLGLWALIGWGYRRAMHRR